MDISAWTAKLASENSKWGLGINLNSFIREAMTQKMITIYEAFQLYEISDRFCHSEIKKYHSFDAVMSMNMALMSKLFDENDLYEHYCNDARERLNFWFDSLKKLNNGKLPKGEHYILNDLEGFISGDLEHMEKLSYIRKNAVPDDTCHFEYFPYDHLKYEDELIKILKGETERYEVDKTISPEICDMMTAVELRAIELE